MESHAADYKEVILFLVAAGVIVPLFHRLKISPVLGFLAAGVAFGPFGFGALAERAPVFERLSVDNDEDIAVLAEFGVVFLLFTIGLELSWERLKALRTLVFGLGLAQVVVCGGAIAGAAIAFGLAWPAALVLGAALALSSTAVVLPVLEAKGRSGSTVGQAAFAVLLLQDIVVAPILIVIGLAGRGGTPLQALGALGVAVLVLALLTFGLRIILRPLMHSVARSRSSELFLAACLLIVVGAGLITAGAGLSMALGAFIAGLLLAETEYRRAAEAMVEPFRGLLLGLFFVSMGIGLDLGLLFEQPLLVLGIAGALVAGKAALIFGLANAFRTGRAAAIEAALVLAPAGEFAFVVLDQASGARLISGPLAEVALVSATLSIFAIPFLAAAGARLGRALDREDAPEAPVAEDKRVLIVGYGRVGRLVADMLIRHRITHLAIDRDVDRVRAGRRAGAPLWFGDAGRPDMLERFGIATASGLVVTLDEPGAAERVVEVARALRPDLTIVVRARDEDHAHRLYALGATDAVPESFEAGLQLAENALIDVGVPMGLVIASIHEKRDEVRAALNVGEEGRQRRSIRSAGATAKV